jgi:hypothetical protein
MVQPGQIVEGVQGLSIGSKLGEKESKQLLFAVTIAER